MERQGLHGDISIMQKLYYEYHLISSGAEKKVIRLEIDPGTLNRIVDHKEPLPDWTRLEAHQCSHCPLGKEEHPHCPVAGSLVGLVDHSDDFMSHDDIRMEVYMPERVIAKDTTVQRAVSSMLGLLVATSSCPHTEFMKPMARFHLPLASEEETIYRATSMYLLAQYFRRRQGQEYDMELQGLVEIYRNLAIINRAMATRLREICSRDSTVNAVVLLDLFTKTLPGTIEDSLREIKYLFAPFMR